MAKKDDNLLMYAGIAAAVYFLFLRPKDAITAPVAVANATALPAALSIRSESMAMVPTVSKVPAPGRLIDAGGVMVPDGWQGDVYYQNGKPVAVSAGVQPPHYDSPTFLGPPIKAEDPPIKGNLGPPQQWDNIGVY